MRPWTCTDTVIELSAIIAVLVVLLVWSVSAVLLQRRRIKQFHRQRS